MPMQDDIIFVSLSLCEGDYPENKYGTLKIFQATTSLNEQINFILEMIIEIYDILKKSHPDAHIVIGTPESFFAAPNFETMLRILISKSKCILRKPNNIKKSLHYFSKGFLFLE